MYVKGRGRGRGRVVGTNIHCMLPQTTAHSHFQGTLHITKYTLLLPYMYIHTCIVHVVVQFQIMSGWYTTILNNVRLPTEKFVEKYIHVYTVY